MYHGLRQTTSKASYRLGLALLDLENPTKVLHILEYIHGCPETQCPDEYCRWFEENRDLSNDPKKGDVKLK